MKIVQDYVTKQEDLNEDNISDYLTGFHNIQTQKSKEEVNKVGYYLILYLLVNSDYINIIYIYTTDT